MKKLHKLPESLRNVTIGYTTLALLFTAGYGINYLISKRDEKVKKITNTLEKKVDFLEGINEKVKKDLTEDIKKFRENLREKLDPIYGIINRIYEKTNPPEYITKELVRAIISVESSDKRDAVSQAGGRGLMQIRPVAWIQVEKQTDYYKKVFDPEKNIRVGIEYLKWLGEYFEKNNFLDWKNLQIKEKQEILLAGYNGGPARLNKRKKIENMPAETLRYIKKVRNTL